LPFFNQSRDIGLKLLLPRDRELKSREVTGGKGPKA